MPRYKVFLVYISNVCDDLPAKDVARSGGRVYRVESRALPQADAERIATGISAEPAALPALIEKLLRLGPPLPTAAPGGDTVSRTRRRGDSSTEPPLRCVLVRWLRQAAA